MSFFKEFFEEQIKHISYGDIDGLEKFTKLIQDTNAKHKKVIIVGNGGSAAIASHFAVDITKNAKMRAINFNESSLITCFANDYGYEQWVAKAVEFYADSEDVLVLISSSGKSENMLNAAKKAKALGITVVTFTGFESSNPLRSLGDLNFWADCRSYNIVENTHQTWLLAVVDRIIGTTEYSAN